MAEGRETGRGENGGRGHAEGPGGEGGYHPLFPHTQPLPDARGDALAQHAVAPVQSGMLVGLGVGRATHRAMRALALRVREEKLDIDCVCAGAFSQKQAEELGLPTITFDEVEHLDYLLDGATEADGELRMLKGAYGAITRQRLIARVADRRVYMTSEDHVSPRLGVKALLAITIIPFGLASIRNALRDMGLSGVLRRTLDGKVFETDGGGIILDARVPDRPLEEVAEALDHVAGVVDHGIFLDEADEILVETKDGGVKRMERVE